MAKVWRLHLTSGEHFDMLESKETAAVLSAFDTRSDAVIEVTMSNGVIRSLAIAHIMFIDVGEKQETPAAAFLMR